MTNADSPFRLNRRALLQLAGATGFTPISAVASASSETKIGRHGTDLTLVDEDPDNGFHYPYYLYTPEETTADPRPILVEPVNTGTSTDDFDRHMEAAEATANYGVGREIADSLAAPFVVPVFPRPRSDPVDADHYVHILDDTTMAIDDGPLERVDLQLLAMVDDARDRLADADYPVADGLMLNGFSAAGNFVDRFAALHPEAVTSVTAGGLNGMPILPIEEADGHTLDYHVGVADLEELIGKQFELEAFADVNRFLYMGEFDSSDTIPYWTDDDRRDAALDVYGPHMIEDRFAYSKSVYDDIGTDAVFRMYEGEGHSSRPAVEDIVAFHERTLAGDEIEAIRADLGGNVPELGLHVEYAPRSPSPGKDVTFDASRSSIRNADLVEFEWQFDDSERTTGTVASHSFESRGGYNVVLVGTDDTGTEYRTVEQIVVEDGSSDELPEPSVTIEDQQSDGTSVVIDEVTTDRPMYLFLLDWGEESDRDSQPSFVSPPVPFEPCASVEDVTVRLTDPTPGTRVYEADLVERRFNSWYGITGSGAEVTVEKAEMDGIGPTLVEADPDAGFHYPYYLYAPPKSGDETEAERPPLVEPVNTGTTSNDFDRHLEAAEGTVDDGVGREVADSLAAPFVVPIFPRPRSDPVDGDHYVHALDDTTMAIDDGPLERVDLQLLAMVDDARDRLADADYPVADGLMLNGFSAAGNFVDRFAALHPEEVVSVTAGGLNGTPILPISEADGKEVDARTLPYHAGIADVKELTGKPFELEAFTDVNRFLYMGGIDTNDTMPGGSSWTDPELEAAALDVYGRNMQADRFPFARAVYDEVDASAVFRMYDRVPHSSSPARPHVVEFHRRSLAGDDIEAIRADMDGGVPNKRAAVNYAPTVALTGEAVVFHALESDVRNATIIDFEWTFEDGVTTNEWRPDDDAPDGSLVTHKFETPGTHVVKLTTIDDAGGTHQAVEHVRVVGESTTVDLPDESTDDSSDESTDDSSDESTDDGTSDATPGLGFGSAIASLSGAGYLLHKRSTVDNLDPTVDE